MICCNRITKIFCTRYGSANAYSARGPGNFGPLTYLAISVFREVSANTVFTQINTSRRRRFVQHVNLTQVLDGNLSHSDLPFLESHCRLTQLWLVK